MKTALYIFMIVLGLTGCTDALTGPDLEPLEQFASTSSTGSIADLSVRLDIDPNLYGTEDLPFFKATAFVHNEGPDDATGVQVAFPSNTDCQVRGSGDTHNDDDGTILVDIKGSMAMNTSVSFQIECSLKGMEHIEIGTEIVRSDVADPDSKPGNRDLNEDDGVWENKKTVTIWGYIASASL